jgi:hypothetical protein
MVLGISMHPFDFTTCVMDNATMGVQIKAQKQTQKQFAHLHNQHRKKAWQMNIANALQPSFLFSNPLDPKKLAAANITTCLHNTIPYHSCGRTGQGGHLKPTDTNTFRFVKQTLLIFCICSCIGKVGSFPASLLAACCRPLAVPDPPPQSPFSYLDVPIQTPIRQPFNFTDI